MTNKDNEDLKRQAMDNTLGLNPVIGIRGKDILSAARTVMTQAIKQPFLSAKHVAHFSLELKNVEGLPNAKVWANVERNKLNGGNANLLVSWDGAAYTFRMSDVDVKAKSGALSVTNAYGVTVDFTSVNLSDGAVAGAVYVEGSKVGEITTLNNGLIKVKYIDGSFEALQ